MALALNNNTENNWVAAGKNSICPKFEKLRYRCHCIVLPPSNQSSNPDA
jgi:hypothetical protein